MSPLEKAASAAFKAYGFTSSWNVGEEHPFIAAAQHDTKEKFRSVARAVLLAVREPGWEAISAGASKDLPGMAAGCLPHWTAMIDAILEQGQ